MIKFLIEERGWRRWFFFCVAVAAILFALSITISAGLRLRRWTWEITTPARFTSDMQRNFRYGSRATHEGFLNIYENVYAQRPPGDYDIDYPPLRLLTFELWILFQQRNHPTLARWDPSSDFNAPLLNFNTFTEAASTIAVFLIIRLWTRPTHSVNENQNPGENWQSWVRACFGALLVWFSPGGLADGHAWASYDVWIPPFFLWAILLASCDWWLAAGLTLGFGAMFKGQMLLTAPFFILWPLIAAQPLRAVRFAAGFIIATASVTAPFILSNEIDQSGIRKLHWGAILWIVGVIVAAGAPSIIRSRRFATLSTNGRRLGWVAVTLIAAILLLWPILRAGNRTLWPILLVGSVAYLTAAWCVRRRWITLVPMTGAATAVFASMALFENSPAWWSVGYRYGAEKFFGLTAGPNANLAALLHSRFNWNDLSDIALTIPAHCMLRWPTTSIDLTTRQFLVGLYFLALGICSIAAALQWRRQDRRFLVAVSTVWLMFYCLLPQMIGRYLLFGSTVGAIAVAESVGLGLLIFFLSTVTAIGTLQCMCEACGGGWKPLPSASEWDRFYSFLCHTTPDIAWAVMLATAVFLYVSFKVRRGEGDRIVEISKTLVPI